MRQYSYDHITRVSAMNDRRLRVAILCCSRSAFRLIPSQLSYGLRVYDTGSRIQELLRSLPSSVALIATDITGKIALSCGLVY